MRIEQTLYTFSQTLDLILFTIRKVTFFRSNQLTILYILKNPIQMKVALLHKMDIVLGSRFHH